MLRFVELIVVVVPSTNKVPVIETLPVAVTLANVTLSVVPTPWIVPLPSRVVVLPAIEVDTAVKAPVMSVFNA